MEEIAKEMEATRIGPQVKLWHYGYTASTRDEYVNMRVA